MVFLKGLEREVRDYAKRLVGRGWSVVRSREDWTAAISWLKEHAGQGVPDNEISSVVAHREHQWDDFQGDEGDGNVYTYLIKDPQVAMMFKLIFGE